MLSNGLERQDSTTEIRKKKYLFWEKPASPNEDLENDKPRFHEIPFNTKFWDLMDTLEVKTNKKSKLFSEVTPKNPSVKKWIMSLWNSNPEEDNDMVDYLLNVFRDSLYTRSKEHNRIVGLLLAPDRLLIIHSRKDISLAEMDDQVKTAEIVLHSKNLLRAAIISKDQNGITFSAFEQNKKLSKAFAEFWQIEPDEVAWESIGSLTLNIEPDSFRLSIQIQIEREQLDELIEEGSITRSGCVLLGNLRGVVTSVDVIGKQMSFSKFIDYYYTEKESLEEYRKSFNKLVPLHSIETYDPELEGHYEYEEDTDCVYKIEATGTTPFLKKSHPRFTICLFTSIIPGIRIKSSMINTISRSIFESMKLSIWHPMLETSNDPLTIGNLGIYNLITINEDINALSNRIIDLRRDASSNKTKAMLKIILCDLWIINANSSFLKDLFTFLKKEALIDLSFEFKQNGFLEKEQVVEFKSHSEYKSSPQEFVNKILLPETRQYFNNGNPTRYCILYGVEDNLKIIPLKNLKNDDATQIEILANEMAFREGYSIKIYPIPTQGKGMVLMALFAPIYDNYS